jgi:D-serine deaminase-like pyridoxal phosphate-dependent protein
MIGLTLNELDTPQLLLDLDGIDRNVRAMFSAGRRLGVKVRVHFKSLKCTGLARYVNAHGADGFLCAKLNEAEFLVDAGLTDVFIANEIIGPIKLRRLANLAKRASIRVCVDDFDNVAALAAAVEEAGATIEVLVEVDTGMARCGVQPGDPVLALARHIMKFPSLRFVGLQGYDGHLQYIPDVAERARRCRECLEKFVASRKLLESSGIPVSVVTGAGTGTWETVASYPGITEIQPGSFILMDAAYHRLQPAFGINLSILSMVVSRRPGQYVLDVGSKGVSQDFGKSAIKGRPRDTVLRVAEEHSIVETGDDKIRVGDKVEVYSGHCCATMNLHRTAIAVRNGKVEAVWPIEASGRYD